MHGTPVGIRNYPVTRKPKILLGLEGARRTASSTMDLRDNFRGRAHNKGHRIGPI